MRRAGHYWTLQDWVHVFKKAHTQGGHLLPLSSLCRVSGLSEPAARKALKRLERRGMISRVGPSLYSSSIFPAVLEEIAMQVGKPCYISFESVLARHGILSQSPLVLTCATPRKPRRLKTLSGEIVFRHLAHKLFWGFREEKGVLWAEPEKALLDWMYWNSQVSGEMPALDELSLEELDRKKLDLWRQRYPRTVQNKITKSII